MENVLEIKNLNFSIRENRILKDISVSIEKGKITGMIGGSGSGKTTLIRTILNIQMPEEAKIEGEIFIKGEIASSENRMYVQPVFQDPGSYFNPRWNLLQCLEEPLNILKSISTEEKLERIKSLMEEFSLSDMYLSQSIKRSFAGGSAN
jgi:ABC-type dipeptide/oligopeptide/nickel transport system ATPase subunit